MLSVDVDFSGIEALAADFPRQIPFATALALTNVAKLAQAEVIKELSDDFTIRGPRAAKGIRIRPARKTDLTAIVGTLDPWLGEHASGAERSDKEAIPMVGRGMPRTRPEAKTTKAKWPAALAKKPKNFFMIAQPGTKRETIGLWRRKTKKGHPIVLLYRFRKTVKIEPTWDLKGHVRRVVLTSWNPVCKAAIERALEGRTTGKYGKTGYGRRKASTKRSLTTDARLRAGK